MVANDNQVPTNPTTIRSRCLKCGNDGDVAVLPPARAKRLLGQLPEWCTCKGVGGPYVAPKGYVAKFTFGGGT